MVKTPTKEYRKGILFVLLAALCFGTLDVIASFLLNSDHSYTKILALRFIVVTVILFSTMILLSIKKKTNYFKIERKHLFWMLAVGAIYFIETFLVWKGLSLIGNVAQTLSIYFTYPFFIAFMTIVIVKRKITFTRWMALLFGITGVLFIVKILPSLTFEGINWFGFFITICSAIGAAVYYLIIQKVVKHYKFVTILFYNFLIAMVLSLFVQNPISIFTNITLSLVMYILTLAIVGSCAAYMLIILAMKRIGAENVSIVDYFQVFLSPFLAFLFLKQMITFPQLLGMISIMVGVYLVRKK